MNIINRLNPTYLFRMPITINLSPLQQVIGAVALMILASYAIYYFFFRSFETSEEKTLKNINQTVGSMYQKLLMIQNQLNSIAGKVEKLQDSDQTTAQQVVPLPPNPYFIPPNPDHASTDNPYGAAQQGTQYPEMYMKI